MRKTMKLKPLLLTLLLLSAGFPASAYYDFYQDGFYFYILSETNRTVEVAAKDHEGNYYSGNVDIPSEIVRDSKTYSVTGIGARAFWDCSRLISVTIPNSITEIGGYAFARSSLTSVDIPNSVTHIGDQAFWDCGSLTSMTIGNSVTTIGQSAFRDCSGLTSVIIPNSVTDINPMAFLDCSGLTSLTIGNSVTFIGYYAFQGCNSLTSVTIPNSVTLIGAGPSATAMA